MLLYVVNKVLRKVQHFFYIPGWTGPCSSSETWQSRPAPLRATSAQHWGRAALCLAQNPLQNAVLNLLVLCHAYHQKSHSTRLGGTSRTIWSNLSLGKAHPDKLAQPLSRLIFTDSSVGDSPIASGRLFLWLIVLIVMLLSSNKPPAIALWGFSRLSRRGGLTAETALALLGEAP